MILALVLASALDAERAIQLANAWKLDEAHAAANAAFVDALACADVDARARALDALGVVARLRGNAVGALDFTSEAIAIASDVDTLARSRNDLGRIHSDLLGDVAAAREEHELVLTLDVRDQRIHVRALNNLGNLAMAEQDLVTARRFYDRAAKLAARAEDEEGALAAEHNIGLALMMAGEPRDALARFARAEEMDRRRGSAQRARILLSRSEAERALGNPHAALSLLREARSSRDFVTSAIVALREADLHIEQRELARAEETLRTARTLATRLRDPSLIALELAYRAKLRLAQARFGEAAELAARAAKTGTLDVVAQASAIAGTAQRRRGNRAAAKRFYRDAIAAIEQQRVRVSTSIDTRLRFFERETFPYVAMVELSDDASEALEFAEAAKARVLREQRPRRAQSSNATFVEYLVTDSVLYAFVVRDSVTMHKIPISRADLDALTQRFAR
ncbi:MAG: tetratricopeptide repeat protein, partial [Thermoanaerobaculia bacterium]